MRNLKKILALLMTGIMLVLAAGCWLRWWQQLKLKLWIGRESTVKWQTCWRSNADSVFPALDTGWRKHEAEA